jgi:uncharacterized SAM-binding protein YcdF (DUF218 family)
MSRRRRRRTGFWGWCFRLLLLVLVWLVGVAGYIEWTGAHDDAAASDVIIVLGAAAYDAKPSPVLEERLRHGIELYRRGLAPKLLFTGGFGTGARFSESQVARRYALRQGVPEGDILIETVSRTTQQNMQQAALVMQAQGLHTAILVSDPLHMARAMRLARQSGIQARVSATPTSAFRTWNTRWKFLAQEVYFFHRDLAESLF